MSPARIVDAFVLRLFLRVWLAKNPKTPNLSPMADDPITQGRIGGLGSPVYIYVLTTSFYDMNQKILTKKGYFQNFI